MAAKKKVGKKKVHRSRHTRSRFKERRIQLFIVPRGTPAWLANAS